MAADGASGRPAAKVAVVTGGSSGIGAALARRLVDRGMRCVLVARGKDRLERVAAEIGADAEVCDVADRSAVEQLAGRVRARHEAVHLLVNNAGIPGRRGFLELAPEQIEQVVRVNYLGGVWCLRAFLPLLEAGAPSVVVNVASVAGTVSGGPSGPYSAAKHAQVAFSRTVAGELAPRGIRVLTVNPGLTQRRDSRRTGSSPILSGAAPWSRPNASRARSWTRSPAVRRRSPCRGTIASPRCCRGSRPASADQAGLQAVTRKLDGVQETDEKQRSPSRGLPARGRAARRASTLSALERAGRTKAQAHAATLYLLLMIKGAPDGSQRSTVTELSRRLQLAQSTVTELVRRAENVGLIAREPSATDGRVAYLRITAEGERRLAGAVGDLGLEQRRLGDVLEENHPSRSRR